MIECKSKFVVDEVKFKGSDVEEEWRICIGDELGDGYVFGFELGEEGVVEILVRSDGDCWSVFYGVDGRILPFGKKKEI